jgi:hypothetical protein
MATRKVVFYDNTKTTLANPEGRPIGYMALEDGVLVAHGGGIQSVIDAARRRGWSDERILYYYSAWSNGYVYSIAAE